MEHALLQDPDLHGYTRLQILSYDRLAEFILSECQTSIKSILSEEGRVMVLRSLLNQIKERLRIFHALKPKITRPGAGIEPSDKRVSTKAGSHLKKSSTCHHQTNSQHEHAINCTTSASYFKNTQSWIQLKKLHDPDHLLDLAADGPSIFKGIEHKHSRVSTRGAMDGWVCISHTSGTELADSSRAIEQQNRPCILRRFVP